MQKCSHITLFLILASATATVRAEGHVFAATNAKWKTECGACHFAYPPQLLPAASWRTMMTQLDKHFGADASLDPKTTAEIRAFLEANAGRVQREAVGKPPLRITESRWFQHEHDEVPARYWKSPAVKSAANCTACHTQAERGDYSERNVHLPR